MTTPPSRWVLFLAIVASLVMPASAPAQEAAPPASAAGLTVGNEAGKLARLAAADWEKLPRRTLEMKEREGPAARYEGVPLAEVLRSAGVPFDGHLRGPRVAEFVLVEAADGYRAVLALAEVDPGMTDKLVLVADRRDGRPLPDREGPFRLVVPGDKVHSRWVRQVTQITVQRPPEAREGAGPKK